MELRDLLRELVESSSADSAAIARGSNGDGNGAELDAQAITQPLQTSSGGRGELRRVPLGRGSMLEVRYSSVADGEARAGALERAARALRACARRWEIEQFPYVDYARSQPLDRDRVRERIRIYLQAFANTQGVANTVVTVGMDVVASAQPLSELQREQLPFLRKQVAAEARRRKGETSHVELVREDACAFSFWVDACLVAFCDGHFSRDFVRHRARMVGREIGQLLPHLDEPPSAPAQSAPLPD